MIAIASFVSGALTMGYLVAALFFARFWRETRDPLFGWFAAAFLLLGIGRALLFVVEPLEILYVLRLIAFVLIIVAIVAKNRRA